MATTSEEKLAKSIALRKLADEFIDVATRLGKIIIEEVRVPPVSKTVKPIAAGGIAGGEKYAAEGIFFKFAIGMLRLEIFFFV